jgi:apolipoprotein N-acyltransferase
VSFAQNKLVAFFCGLALPFSFSPYNLYPLASLVFCVFLFLLRGLLPREAARTGLWFGIGMFCHGVSWIQVSLHQFGIPNYLFSGGVTLIFIFCMALYCAAFAFATRLLSVNDLSFLIISPVLWVLCEMVRGTFLSGFPWLLLGYSQITGPLAGYTPIIGAYGVSLIVAALGSLVCATVIFEKRKSIFSATAILLILLTGNFLRDVDFTQSTGRTLTVALVQGAIPQSLKWEPDLREWSIDKYRALTEPHWGVDVVVWPETAIPAFQTEVMSILEDLRAKSQAYETDLVVGMPTWERKTGRYFNSIINLRGSQSERYDKRHLVPFGEYLPAKNYLSGLAAVLDMPMSDFSPGSESAGELSIAGEIAAVSICYESAFGEQMRKGLHKAAFLLNLSNDAWFGRSLAPHQHLQINQIRALESGRELLRSTNNGISVIINHRGEVRTRAEQFASTVITGTLNLRSGSTPFVKYGSWPVFFLMLFGTLAFFYICFHLRRSV